jgi:hypothetical protein
LRATTPGSSPSRPPPTSTDLPAADGSCGLFRLLGAFAVGDGGRFGAARRPGGPGATVADGSEVTLLESKVTRCKIYGWPLIRRLNFGANL